MGGLHLSEFLLHLSNRANLLVEVMLHLGHSALGHTAPKHLDISLGEMGTMGSCLY